MEQQAFSFDEPELPRIGILYRSWLSACDSQLELTDELLPYFDQWGATLLRGGTRVSSGKDFRRWCRLFLNDPHRAKDEYLRGRDAPTTFGQLED